ncbi:hypothetical protein FCU94_11730 [Vibrio sp. JPW-9-11-11]|uniref:hypothetical protein n=1 Tax=Vibrio sp. JPW-9-11-11 TaxID=1416532 RepID=UPI001594CA45|nr:hypothetical protein [Vibrio sp. JPW-9-11-11]NVD07560.1 hypothetical protein [Vibrio sp. JPW-9-11-11]
MDICQIKKGMLVECQQGIGKVLVIDRTTNCVLIEEQSSQQQMAVDVQDLVDNPQLHQGCEQYD